LAIHAKRVTIMQKDMQLLRDLWRRINPDSAIGHPNEDTSMQTRVNQTMAEQNLRKKIEAMQEKVYRLRGMGALDRLTVGEHNFCRGHNINYM